MKSALPPSNAGRTRGWLVSFIVALLLLLAFGFRRPATPETRASASVSTSTATRAAVANMGPSALTIPQSLRDAFDAARSLVEPIGEGPAEIPAATHHARTPWSGIHTYFSPDGIHVRPAGSSTSAWRWNVRLASYGYLGSEVPVARAAPVSQKNSVEYDRGSLTEWYVNTPRGLEQGFTLTAPPPRGDAADTALALTLDVDSALTAKLNATADSVVFSGAADEPVLHYAGLLAWDATGRPLAARIELRPENRLALLVDDRNARYPVTIDPLIFAHTRIVPPQGYAGAKFGATAAIDGNTIVIGAPEEFHSGQTIAGAAYVFVGSGGSWDFQGRLIASTPAHDAFFGTAVDVDGDTIVVGAPERKGDPGTASIFVRTGSTWTHDRTLTGAPGFGQAVGVSGKTIVVGSPSETAGKAYIYAHNPGVSASLQAVLNPSSLVTQVRFGDAVAIDGDTIAVGAPWDQDAGLFAGAAYVFAGLGWPVQGKIFGSDTKAQAGFGQSVALDADTLVVGSPSFDYDNFTNDSTGAAYAFVRSGGAWTQQAKFGYPTVTLRALFGTGVGVDGDMAVITAPGVAGFDAPRATVVMARSGTTWSKVAEFNDPSGQFATGFGTSAGISDGTIVVGASGESTPFGSKAGAAYVFTPVIATQTDLGIGIGIDKLNVKQGESVTYTITVKNFGTATANNVVVEAPLASGTAFIAAQKSKGAVSAPANGQNGTVLWNIPELAGNGAETAQIKVTVLLRGKTTYTQAVSVSADTDDPNLANNSASVTVTVGAGSGGKSK